MRERPGINDSPRPRTPFHGGRDSKEGFRLGNYQLLEPIGSGNFGVVYLAQHIHLGHRRAVKTFEFSGSAPDPLEAFLRSSRYLSTLNHPNIVRMHDFGVEKNTAYLVMDLIEPGVSLDLIERPPVRATLGVRAQVSSALGYAHSQSYRDDDGREHQGIFHGDVKPANVLVSGEIAYVTDFMLPNMEEFRERGHGHPCFPYYDTRFYGTPMYMSPEQLRGVVNAQTDIFSFGIFAYELLTGKYPWKDEREFMPVFYSDEKGIVIPQAPRTLNESVPDSVSAAVLSCLELHTGDRPRNFGEVTRTLTAAVETARPPTHDRSASADHTFAYDVALSFAGSERPLAEQLYTRLRDHCRIFYDAEVNAKTNLWGADLPTVLHTVYSSQARYCVVLLSRQYVERAWTNWERRAILQRMVSSVEAQYLLPVQVDDVELPGLPTTIGMLKFADEGPEGIVAAVLKKLTP